MIHLRDLLINQVKLSHIMAKLMKHTYTGHIHGVRVVSLLSNIVTNVWLLPVNIFWQGEIHGNCGIHGNLFLNIC